PCSRVRIVSCGGSGAVTVVDADAALPPDADAEFVNTTLLPPAGRLGASTRIVIVAVSPARMIPFEHVSTLPDKPQLKLLKALTDWKLTLLGNVSVTTTPVASVPTRS